MRKNNGPSTVPWGTPERTGAKSDSSPSTTTDICLSVRKAHIQELTGPVTPQEANLPRSHSCGTVSKARLKSSVPTSTCVCLSKDLKRSLRVIRSCVSQEWPLRNPCWAWIRTLFSSRKFKICRHITGIDPEAVKWGDVRYDCLLCPGLQPGPPSQTPGGLGQRYWSMSEVMWPPKLELQRWQSSGRSSLLMRCWYSHEHFRWPHGPQRV